MRCVLSDDYEAIPIRNPHELGGYLATNKTQLLVLDLDNQPPNILDILKTLKLVHGDLKVLLISTNPSWQTQAEVVTLGGVRFLDKMANPSALKERVEALLRGDTITSIHRRVVTLRTGKLYNR